jgi:hypothetical protein
VHHSANFKIELVIANKRKKLMISDKLIGEVEAHPNISCIETTNHP